MARMTKRGWEVQKWRVGVLATQDTTFGDTGIRSLGTTADRHIDGDWYASLDLRPVEQSGGKEAATSVTGGPDC